MCDTSIATRKTILVENVHAFPGHIACDPASNSELVVPLIRSGTAYGVLDMDSPRTGRFEQQDLIGIEALVQLFVVMTDLDHA